MEQLKDGDRTCRQVDEGLEKHDNVVEGDAMHVLDMNNEVGRRDVALRDDPPARHPAKPLDPPSGGEYPLNLVLRNAVNRPLREDID